MPDIFAYLDEYGTNELDISKEGVSTHFIVSAILVEQGNLIQLIDRVEAIRKRHFQESEIKSSKIAGNHTRRLKILSEITSLEFKIFAIIVDKSKLKGKGFGIKTSFYKFINSLIHRELFNNFPDISVTADEHGSIEFMKSFEKYIKDNHMPRLFSNQMFNFEKSTNNVLIQLSDLISGTLGYCFDVKREVINPVNC